MELMEAYSIKMTLQRTSNKSAGLQETKPERHRSALLNPKAMYRGTLALMKCYHCSTFGKHRFLK